MGFSFHTDCIGNCGKDAFMPVVCKPTASQRGSTNGIETGRAKTQHCTAPQLQAIVPYKRRETS